MKGLQYGDISQKVGRKKFCGNMINLPAMDLVKSAFINKKKPSDSRMGTYRYVF